MRYFFGTFVYIITNFFIRDKFSFVRVEAVKAMIRMQDPDDEEDEVTSMYTSLMCSDTSGYTSQVQLAASFIYVQRRSKDSFTTYICNDRNYLPYNATNTR